MGITLDLSSMPIPPAEGAHLIGKGPSLDQLSPSDFPDPTRPVLAINESIHAVERLGLPNPIFSIVQDGRVAAASRPAQGTWLLSKQAWQAGNGSAHPRAFMFTPGDLNSKSSSLTACVAMQLLSRAGIKCIKMHAFDAKFGNEMKYAKCIGYEHVKYNKDKNRFKRYIGVMQRCADSLDIALEWIPPAPLWQVAVMVPIITNCAARHVRAFMSQARKCLPNASFTLFTDLPGGDHRLKDLQTRFPVAGLFQQGVFTDGFPVLYLPVTALPIRTLRLPSPLALAEGQLYRGALAGTKAGALMWRAGTVTSPYDRCRTGNYAEEKDLLLSLPAESISDIGSFLSVSNWPCKMDTDIIQFSGSQRPWGEDVKLLTLTEY